MGRMVDLWRSPTARLNWSDHPPEHGDQPFQAVATAFAATFVEVGSFDLEAEGQRWRLDQGDVFLRRPGLEFWAGFEGAGFTDRCLTVTCLAPDPDFSTPGPVLRATPALAAVQQGLRRAAAAGSGLYIDYAADRLFRQPVDHSPVPASRLGWYAERVHAARERIEADHAEPIAAADLAAEVGISPFQFVRAFKAVIGLPPHRYLIDTRLRAAAALLREGASVTSACFASGFNELSHFSRSFQQRFGCPPSRYRG
jgi:AraC-like DNA-binding protein